MKKATLKLAVVMAGFLTAMLLLSFPSASYAVAISTVSAFSGGTTFTLWGGGLPVTLTDSQSLILIQTISGTGANFDTSDQCGPGTSGPACSTVGPPTVTVNGKTFTDGTNTKNVLGFNYSGGNPTSNESQNWSLIGSGADFSVFVGYADNSHTQGCPAADPSCHPTGPWIGDAGVTTIGTLGTVFDTGAILITATKVPEPSALLLIGAGFLGLAAWGRRRANRKQ